MAKEPKEEPKIDPPKEEPIIVPPKEEPKKEELAEWKAEVTSLQALIADLSKRLDKTEDPKALATLRDDLSAARVELAEAKKELAAIQTQMVDLKSQGKKKEEVDPPAPKIEPKKEPKEEPKKEPPPRPRHKGNWV